GLLQAVRVIGSQIGQFLKRKHAEDEHKKSEMRFRSLTMLTADTYWEQDEHYRFTLFTGTGKQWIDGVRRTAIGKTRWEMGFLNMSAADWAAHIAVCEAHQPYYDLELYMLADGKKLWVSVSGEPIHDESGAFKGYRGVGKDITDRRLAQEKLRASEERFRSLTALSSDWYWEQDEQFRFTVVSGGIQAGFGISPQAVLGKTRWDVAAVGMTDEDWAAHKAVLEAHQPFRDFEYARLDAQGRVRHRSVSGEPMFDEHGRFAGYRGVGRDITERKAAQAKLKQAHDDLARSNAELEQFAYVASHDLQEPLRMVSSYTQLLARRYGERLDGDAREFMDFIVDGAARMKRLIEDLLIYSRVGTRGKEFRPVAGEHVLARARNNLKAAIEASGATITHDPLPVIEADDSQLVQLLQNLIGNALKFHGAEPPRVHVGAAERGDDWVISVRDNGIGIEPQYFERIFLMFQRLHDRGEYPGTGIGLAICKKVVDRHGGRIWVESVPGEGSAFRFTLPKQRGDQ
ncbi:MAG: PAS domain S-box protein, partial [Betaproteobacteria bacterium]|nr:PAS domain S-box protein [Betaproteobacteria bacterium]